MGRGGEGGVVGTGAWWGQGRGGEGVWWGREHGVEGGVVGTGTVVWGPSVAGAWVRSCLMLASAVGMLEMWEVINTLCQLTYMYTSVPTISCYTVLISSLFLSLVLAYYIMYFFYKLSLNLNSAVVEFPSPFPLLSSPPLATPLHCPIPGLCD